MVISIVTATMVIPIVTATMVISIENSVKHNFNIILVTLWGGLHVSAT
jgi:hypothetical protein